MENRRKNINNNGQTRCKKHPKHIQSPGVCSICLGERLSQISTTSSSRRPVEPLSSLSSSSSLSSLSSSSSESSPVHHRATRSGAGAKWSKNNAFGKSRSMAFLGEEEGKKKSGFWSKLLRPRGHKKNIQIDGGFAGFVHSRTMRERTFATRVY